MVQMKIIMEIPMAKFLDWSKIQTFIVFDITLRILSENKGGAQIFLIGQRSRPIKLTDKKQVSDFLTLYRDQYFHFYTTFFVSKT